MVIQANDDQPAGRLERLRLPAPIIKPIRRASILIRRAIIFWKEPRAAIISCLRFVWKERRELRPLVNANSSVLFEGARYSADMPLLAGTDLLPEIQRDHFAEAYAPPIKIATLRNVLVSGRSCVGTHRHVYLLGNLQPDYVDEYLAKGLLDDDLAPPWKHEQNLLADELALSWKNEQYLPGTSILVTHFNVHTYGHWLLECVPRLLLLRRIQDRLSPFRIIVHKSTKSFVKEWLSFILPKVEIKIYDDATEYVRCESLLIPSLLCSGQDWAFHPLFNSLIAELVPTNALPKRRLYLTRQVPSHFRRLSNKEEIESIASSFGLELISPETLPIPKQIELFSECAFVVGEFGSALHNTLFSPLGIRVLGLNWLNGMQSKISQLRKQSVGYLLPSSGLPVKYEWGAAPQTYHINPRRFRDILSVID
jgi:Glycosyltransferase 61